MELTLATRDEESRRVLGRMVMEATMGSKDTAQAGIKVGTGTGPRAEPDTSNAETIEPIWEWSRIL